MPVNCNTANVREPTEGGLQMSLAASSEKHVVRLQLKTNCSKLQTATAPEHDLGVSCRTNSRLREQPSVPRQCCHLSLGELAAAVDKPAAPTIKTCR